MADNRRPLKDGTPPLGEIRHMLQFGADSLLVADNSGLIHLFVNNEFQHTVGSRGKGPGEYNTITYFTVVGDSLFVLDRSLSKIISYSLTNSRLLDEIVLPELSQFIAFERINGETYLCFASYTAATDLTSKLLFRYDERKQIVPLNISLKDVHVTALSTTLKLFVPMKRWGSKIVILFPLSDNIVIYDTETDSFETFEVPLERPTKSGGSVNDMASLLQYVNEMEIPMGIYPQNSWVALVTKKGKSDDVLWKIRLLSYTGRVGGEIATQSYVFHVDQENYYTQVFADETTNPQFPYEIVTEILPDR